MREGAARGELAELVSDDVLCGADRWHRDVMWMCGADRWHRWWWIPPPRTRRRWRDPPARVPRREAAAARELRLRFGVRGFRAGASFASRGARGRRGSPLYQMYLGQSRRPDDACEPGPAGGLEGPPLPRARTRETTVEPLFLARTREFHVENQETSSRGPPRLLTPFLVSTCSVWSARSTGVGSQFPRFGRGCRCRVMTRGDRPAVLLVAESICCSLRLTRRPGARWWAVMVSFQCSARNWPRSVLPGAGARCPLPDSRRPACRWRRRT